jgi:phage-related protein
MPVGVRKQFDTKLRYLANDAPVSGIASWKGIGSDGKELKSGGYRLVLTTEFPDAVHVLHAFKKDSSRGRKTRGRHVELIEQRYKYLCAEYANRASKQ